MIRSQFLAALGGAVTVGQAGPFTPSLRIAVVAPQSGDAADLGRQLSGGAQAAVDDLNNAPSALGVAFLLSVFDDHNDPGDAIVQGGFAAENPDVTAVIGHLGAAPTLAALPGYANANVPLIVPTVTDDRVTARGYRNVFRLLTKDSDEGGLLAARAIRAGSTAPLVLTGDSDYGPAVADGFVRRAAALRRTATKQQIALRNADFAAAAGAALAAHPDSITLAGTVTALGPLLSALRAQGYAEPVYASQGFFDAVTTKTYAKDAEGIVISTDVPYLPLAPGAQADLRQYVARYGDPTPIAAHAYAAVQLVAAAARRTGATNRLTLLRALTSGGTFDTIAGSYIFGPYGDPIDPNCYFYVVRGGAFAYDRQAHPSGFMLK